MKEKKVRRQIHKTRYWIPLTYFPKIPGVLDGTIRQTIRIHRTYEPGDRIAFHGWAGVPYRSPWSFRTEYFVIETAFPIVIFEWGIMNGVDGMAHERFLWEQLDSLAEKDGIVPATGEELGRVLTAYHKIPECGLLAQVLRWRVDS